LSKKQKRANNRKHVKFESFNNNDKCLKQYLFCSNTLDVGFRFEQIYKQHKNKASLMLCNCGL